MPVKVEVSYAVSMNDAAPWRIKAELLKTIEGSTFVKLRPHEEAFARFCVQGCLELPKKCRPSLGQCQGWKAFLQLRNSAMAQLLRAAGDDESLSLFGNQEQRSKKNAPRVNAAKLQEIREQPEVMEVFVPGVGDNPGMSVSTIRPAHPCDDPFVLLDADSIEHIVLYMQGEGVDLESITSKRGCGGMDRQPGVWKNGNGSVVKALEKASDSEGSGDEGAIVKRKLRRVKPVPDEDTAGVAPSEEVRVEPTAAPISDA